MRERRSAILKISAMLRIISMVIVLISQQVLPITILRSDRGDVFDNIQDGSRACHNKKASCVDDKCQRCECDSQETYFKNLCYADISHSAIECGFALEDSQYYGLETIRLTDRTVFGYIVRDKNSDSRSFTKCTLVEGKNGLKSEYWDTREWADLFNGGRDTNDFSFVKDGDGLRMKFHGDAMRYTGMLLKMALECESDAEWTKMTSCMLIPIGGQREYRPTTTPVPTKSTTILTTTTSTTHNNNTTTTHHPTAVTMRTHHSVTTWRPPVTLTPEKIPSKKQNKDNLDTKIGLLLLCVLIFLVLIVGAWHCCCSHGFSRKSTFGYSEGVNLVTPTLSYCSTEDAPTSVSSAVSSNFSEIRQPNYGDIDELYRESGNNHDGGKSNRKSSGREDGSHFSWSKKSSKRQSFTNQGPFTSTSRPFESEDHTIYPYAIGSSSTNHHQ